MSTAALAFIKISCLLFFGRIFRTGSNTMFDIAFWTMLIIVTIWGLSFTFGFMFICGTHFDWNWTSVENSLKCGDLTKTNQSLSLSDVIMDFLIMVFPMPLVCTISCRLLEKRLTADRSGGCDYPLKRSLL